jgi:hypothetical protein
VSGETTVIEAAAVATAAVLSCTCTTKFEVPGAVGVPEITPVVGEMFRPAGREPEAMLQLYGVTPPAAISAVVYATPTSPCGWGPPINVSGGTGFEMRIDLFAVTVKGTELLSVSCRVNIEVPAVVGVPEITPVAALNVRPAGRVPLRILVVRGAVPGAETIVVL